jgi:hypothetical protein
MIKDPPASQQQACPEMRSGAQMSHALNAEDVAGVAFALIGGAAG